MNMAAVFTANETLITSALNVLYMLRNFPCSNPVAIFQSLTKVSLGSSTAPAAEEMSTTRWLILFCSCPSFLPSQKSADLGEFNELEQELVMGGKATSIWAGKMTEGTWKGQI